MTYADGRKEEVKAVAREAQKAVVRGQNALQFTTTAVGKHIAATADIEQVLKQVYMEIDVLKMEILPKMHALFAGSLSQDVSSSLEYFKASLSLLENYANHLKNRLTLMDQTNALMAIWKEEELNASGVQMLEAMRLLAEYNSRL